jgi:hypothetical protein
MSPNNQIPSDSNIVNGSPSKELFVSMLTRDISLIDAISDLIDNCVDGAIRLKGKGKFTGLEVDLTITEDCFKIKDNCGGIDKELARKYAFRFGRPLDATQIDYSVGQFGIGMKRALFKMGKKFEIKSVSEKASFSIEIDVNKWSKEEKWDFKFKKTTKGNFSLKKRGTEITVSSLTPDVIERFKQKNFQSELKEKLSLQHLMNISRGLAIKINTHLIKPNQLELLNGNNFKTAYWAKKFKIYGNTTVKIYAGIGTQDLDMGGWYIFCNNRLIEGPEQTQVTGWGVKTPVRIPKYHIQFSRFRGLVLFESKAPSFLPWNTSKTSADTDSPIFQSVRLEMVRLMRSIITFLNKVHDESVKFENAKVNEKYLQSKIDRATLKDYSKVKKCSTFTAPTQRQKVKETNEVKIRYVKTKDKVEKLKKVFHVSSSQEVGEKTFDYTYSRECKG